MGSLKKQKKTLSMWNMEAYLRPCHAFIMVVFAKMGQSIQEWTK